MVLRGIRDILGGGDPCYGFTPLKTTKYKPHIKQTGTLEILCTRVCIYPFFRFFVQHYLTFWNTFTLLFLTMIGSIASTNRSTKRSSSTLDDVCFPHIAPRKSFIFGWADGEETGVDSRRLLLWLTPLAISAKKSAVRELWWFFMWDFRASYEVLDTFTFLQQSRHL